jgi:hypothetical protein
MKITPQAKLKCAIVCTILIVIIFSIDLMLPLGVAGGVPYIAVVLMSLRSNNSKFTIYTAIACSLLTVIGYFFSPEGGELWKVLTNRALALFAIWVTALLALKIIHETQKEIEELRKIVPICSSCKKIRDDEGYWNQIESYIHEHSEAQLSHGICPDCFKKLYPDYEYKSADIDSNKKS